MMICLTAKLLDAGHGTIVHLMNDSVDLLIQNLDQFKLAGLAPHRETPPILRIHRSFPDTMLSCSARRMQRTSKS